MATYRYSQAASPTATVLGTTTTTTATATAPGHSSLNYAQNLTQTLNAQQNRIHVRQQYGMAAPTPSQPTQPRKPNPHEQDLAVNSHPTSSSETPSPFFMKPLTRAPDYRFNLYVKGLAPTTTTRGLFELFKP